jgi:hypothetical protein
MLLTPKATPTSSSFRSSTSIASTTEDEPVPAGHVYATMVAAGYAVEILFGLFHLVPAGPRHTKVSEASIHLNYTTVLNAVGLLLALVLVVRLFRTGGRAMLKMMDEPMDEGHEHHHGDMT